VGQYGGSKSDKAEGQYGGSKSDKMSFSPQIVLIEEKEQRLVGLESG
jgi:hypothetical protein